MKVKITLLSAVFGVFSLLCIGQENNTYSSTIFKGFQKEADLFLVSNAKENKQLLENRTGIQYLDLDCIRQKGNREFPYPIKGHQLITNPPVFIWPMDGFVAQDTFPSKVEMHDLDNYSKYAVQLSRSKDFSKDVKTVNNLRLPFYHPHAKLENGKWYWRYCIESGQEEQEWSKIYETDIDKTLPVLESLSAVEAYDLVPKKHPRVYKFNLKSKRNEDQDKLITRLNNLALKELKKGISKYEVKAEPIPATATEAERSQIERFRSKYRIGNFCKGINNFIQAYMLDENKEIYLKKAIMLADNLLKYDPEKLYKKSDFAGASAMSSLAMIYDLAKDKLTVAKRKKYESFISIVIPLILSHEMEGNVGSADGILSAHFFQATFYNTFAATMIMKDHIPNTEIWFKMLYDIWLARTPGGGFMDDGAWPNGNIGYVHVNMRSMVSNYLLFKDLFNVDIFQHPFYKNFANALAYVFPAGSCGDGFGDGGERISDRRNPLRADFAYVLGQETNNPFALEYAYKLTKQNPKKPFVFSKENFADYRLQHQPKDIKPVYNKEIPQDAVFPQSGIAVMHTDLQETKNNLFVSFRSSPFGVGSHGHAEQNSFNIMYKGQPVFYPTGYRITSRDKHYLLAQKHSRAKNTITVNGKTQAYAQNAYGWIARFLSGKQISYVLGDASRAYKEFHETSVNWKTVLQLVDSYKSEEGFIINKEDDPKIKLFRRHVALLRPNTVVVYDELESEKEVTWTLQLNGRERSNFSLDKKQNQIIANTDNCDAAANVYASMPIKATLIDTNYVKPFDWLNPQRGRPAQTFESKQYHSKFENISKTKRMRFLTIIQLDEDNKLQFQDLNPSLDGVIKINGYEITAELNCEKPARLLIEDKKSDAHLLYGASQNEKFTEPRKFTNSTVLYDKLKGFQEAIDTYPLMVPDTEELVNN